jgi:hypothetical protein
MGHISRVLGPSVHMLGLRGEGAGIAQVAPMWKALGVLLGPKSGTAHPAISVKAQFYPQPSHHGICSWSLLAIRRWQERAGPSQGHPPPLLDVCLETPADAPLFSVLPEWANAHHAHPVWKKASAFMEHQLFTQHLCSGPREHSHTTGTSICDMRRASAGNEILVLKISI